MTPPTERDEPERDPWLSQALRHAPDASTAPPAELSEAILRAARRAVAQTTPATRPAPSALARWWSWLAQPPIAAGFATLMVAVLVGVIWYDRPLDEALPPRSDTRADAPATAPDAATEAAPAANTATPPAAAAKKDTAPAAPRREAEAPDARAAREQPAAPAQHERKREAAAHPSPATPDPKPTAPAAPPAPAPAPAPFSDETTRASPAGAAAAAPMPATAPPAARDEALAERRSAESSGALAKSSAPVAAAPAPAPAATLALRAQRAGGVVLGLPETISPPYERWTWQRGAEAHALTPAVRRWIEQLNRVARWRAADGLRPVAGDGVGLTLLRDGAPYATFQVDADTVWYTPVDGAPSLAPLSAIESAALRSELLAATP